MIFLRATRTPATAPWWASAHAVVDRPQIVSELVRDDSVVCDMPEAENALAWARALAGWSDETPALWLHDPHAERMARGLADIPPGVAPTAG